VGGHSRPTIRCRYSRDMHWYHVYTILPYDTNTNVLNTMYSMYSIFVILPVPMANSADCDCDNTVLRYLILVVYSV